LATLGIAAAGTLYGTLVMVGAGTACWRCCCCRCCCRCCWPPPGVLEAGTDGAAAGDGAWLGLLAVFAALYGGVGMLTFGSLIEEA
jgi:hypothetical protein